MKSLLTVLCASFFLVHSFAEDADKKVTPDPFDISAMQKRTEEIGIPTPALVKELEDKANTLAREAKWKEAADAYEIYAKASNMLANLLRSANKPFYNASYDDRKSYRVSDKEIAIEKASNLYKGKRNEAMLARAECYMKLNDHRTALPVVYRVLDLINVHDSELWERARRDMFQMIQYVPENK